MKGNKILANNIIMLYIMNITQLVLPLATLPYLTRVLSVEGYGVVSYVKSIMTYATLVIEFGFILSGTRDIVEAKSDKKKIGKIIGRITEGKLILSLISLFVLFVMIFTIPLLSRHILFTLLSFVSPFLSIFLYDYLFRGLEKMQIVTMRYLIMKGISTFLTFIVIKSESQLIMIPMLDILGSFCAVCWVHREVRKLGIKISKDSISEVIRSIRVSFTYFLSDVATTAFGALNTFFVGIFLSVSDVAFWGITMSFVGAVQSMYSPISDGIYPHMIKTKNLELFIKIILFFIPFLIMGGLTTFFGAKFIMYIIGGQKYIVAAWYLKETIPLLIISFFSILFGWPLLGAIDKVRETTTTTVVTAILQVIGLALLIVTKDFTIPLLIFVRTITELFMAIFRILYAYRFRELFRK